MSEDHQQFNLFKGAGYINTIDYTFFPLTVSVFLTLQMKNKKNHFDYKTNIKVSLKV